MTPGGGTPRLVILAALAVMMLASLAAPAGAYTETFQSGTYTEESASVPTQDREGDYPLNLFRIRAIEQTVGLSQIKFSASCTNCLPPADDHASCASEFYDFESGDLIGTGTIQYTVNYDLQGRRKSVDYVFDLDCWDVSGRTGWARVSIAPSSPILPRTRYWAGSPPQQSNHPYLENEWSAFAIGDYEYRYDSTWKNTLTITEDSKLHIALNRYGGTHGSKFMIQGPLYTYSTLFSYDDEDVTHPLENVPLRISVQNPAGIWFNRTYGSGGTVISDFSLSVSPKEGAIYAPITATLNVCDGAPEYDCVYWNWDSYDVHDDRQYRKINGTWHETRYNSTVGGYVNTPTTDNPLVQSISFPDEGVNHRISVRVYNLANSEKLANLTEYVTVSGQSSIYWPLYVGVYDGVTGKALLNVNCEIKNLNTGETTTKTIQRNYFGENLQLNAVDAYKISISKNGYESRTWDRLTSRTTKITAYLPKLADPEHPDQIKIYLTVAEPGGQPIPGATVQVSGLPVAVTNAQGQVGITATANTTYQYTVSKTGYIGASDTLTTLSTSFWQVIHLTPEGAVPTTDPAPGQTVAPGTTPDYRTVDQKATSALGILFDQVELIAALAGLILVCNMLTWILPGGGRRR